MQPRIELAKRRKALGLSQEKLAELLDVHRTTIVRWEAGGELYDRQLTPLARHLQITVEQLHRLLDGRSMNVSDDSAANAGLLGLSLVDPLEPDGPVFENLSPQPVVQLIEQLSAVDNSNGPRSVLEVVEAKQDQVTKLLTATGPLVPGAHYAASRFAEFQGWLYHDLGQLDLAMQWTNTALDLATLSGDDELVAYIWMRKSNIASDANQGPLAISFARSSRQQTNGITPRLQAVVERQEAYANALIGEDYECARLLDAAHESVADADEAGAEIAAYCSESYIEMESANAWIELGHYDRAIPVLEAADQEWSSSFRRDHGLCKARLSLAYAGNGQPEDALAKATEGIQLVESTNSERSLHFVRRTVNQLRIVGAPETSDELASRLPLAS